MGQKGKYEAFFFIFPLKNPNYDGTQKGGEIGGRTNPDLKKDPAFRWLAWWW